MKTIAENLQILKDSTDAIKQAIIDNGGTVTGGLSSYADAINALFLITFTINSVEYQAEEGMTWEEWVNSDYNTGSWKISNNYIKAGENTLYYPKRLEITPWYVYKNDKINNLEEYGIYGGLSDD